MSENILEIEDLIDPSVISALDDHSKYIQLYHAVNESLPVESTGSPNNQRALLRLAVIYSSQGFSLLTEEGIQTESVKKSLGQAYYYLKNINPSEIEEALESAIGLEGVPTLLVYHFWLAILGTLSGNGIKARLELKRYSSPFDEMEENDWGNYVLAKCLDATILLTRKQNGLQDIRGAMDSINALKEKQNQFESEYLQGISSDSSSNDGAFSDPDSFAAMQEIHVRRHAIRLLGIYHLAKVLTETAEYLVRGYGYQRPLPRIIRRHAQNARDCFASWPQLLHLTSFFEYGSISLYQNSIWFRTQGLGASIQSLCERLAEREIIELLPSQQEALEKNLLDPASNVAVLQMPTSAGKSLMAEFSILQTLALRNDAKIIYIAPTRALVNQIWGDLKEDFEGLGLSIEKTSKVNEIDPEENLLLHEEIDILVSTHEKIDLLIRKDHPSVSDIALIIVDEAHNIADGIRGARLELLLTILKRERPQSKFLLLSPFMENAQALTQWLAGGNRAIPPIKVDWKPSDKLIAGIKEVRGAFQLEIIPSVHGIYSSEEENNIPIQQELNISSSGTKTRLREAVCKSFSQSGKSILYLCRGKATSEKYAREVKGYIEPAPSELKDLVARFVDLEVGSTTVLSEVLPYGIGVHHAGLTEDSRQLVEYLIRKKEIQHIFATTTVAQGINFPISSVYIDSFLKGRDAYLSSHEIMNVAGRAGRTLVDSIGKVIFPFNTTANRDRAFGYIQQETEQVISALTSLLINGDTIIQSFSEGDSQDRAMAYQSNDALAPLVQYFIHLLNMANEDAYFGELEDIFRDSFGYQTLSPDDRSLFLKICTTIYRDLETRTSRGIRKLADTTGFSVPSVLRIMEANRERPEISLPESWSPQNLFGNSTDYLRDKIEVIAQLREVQLGTQADNAPFNPQVIAEILKGWVNGKNINDLSQLHPFFNRQENANNRINDFTSFLTSATFKASWGLSALEGIVNGSEEETADNSHIPSMVYYGVKSPEAIAMRMLGVPRQIAPNLARIVYPDRTTPSSFTQLRNRISELGSSDWESIVPGNSPLNQEEWKTITGILTK